DNFMEFSKQFEGAVDYMFLDNKGRVGTAYGIDLDFDGNGPSPSIELSRAQGLKKKALSLKWVYRGTTNRASDAVVTSAWETIKAAPWPRDYTTYKDKTNLQLAKDSMTNRVKELLAINESVLKGNPAFRNLDNWPADAQLALFGLSWNGAGWLTGSAQVTLPNPPAFRAACQ